MKGQRREGVKGACNRGSQATCGFLSGTAFADESIVVKKIPDPALSILEDFYDSGHLSGDIRPIWPDAFDLLKMLESPVWVGIYEMTWRVFNLAHSPDHRAFILQWGVGATEIQCDLEKRRELLDWWDKIEGWEQNPYCKHLHLFQKGLSCFFESSLEESKTFLKESLQIAKNHRYKRGIMRCYFHLGLVYRDLQENEKALWNFKQSQEVAEKKGASRYLKRIDFEISQLDHKMSGPSTLQRAIESLLNNGHFVQARAALMEGDLVRRFQGLSRDVESLYAYLPLVALGLKKTQAAQRLMARIKDQVIKSHVLRIKKKIFGLSDKELAELEMLQSLQGASEIFIGENLGVGGVPLSSIKSQDARNLLLLLLRSRTPLSKEALYAKVWGEHHRPQVYDTRIYRLLAQVKGELNLPDLIESSHEGIMLNPKYVQSEEAQGAGRR